MRIIYLTTALKKEDFAQFSKMWRIALNPSNQNYHNKMIRSLAISNKVDVISMRPFSISNCKSGYLPSATKEDGNITWHYLKVAIFKFWRNKFFEKEAIKILKKLDLSDAVIVTDTINPTVVTLANTLKKTFNLNAVGTATDSPSNISGTGRSYTLYLLKQAEKLDGFITLTRGLNDVFNQNGRPFEVIEGITENEFVTEDANHGKYFFFGGALMAKYGVYNLIEAFKRLNRNDINLILCGHHCDNKTLNEKIKGCSNIKYFKLLPVNQVMSLEAGALANINPRPYTEDLDRYSIPSKTLEYLCSGSITISVKNSILQPKFNDVALWIKSNSVDDIYDALQSVLNMSDEQRNTLAIKAKEKTMNFYSLSSVNPKLTDFLKQFIKK